ncbi:hypothetical protein ACEPAG_4181 [Sanghuangporus baumii]
METLFCVKESFTPNKYADVILRSCDGFDFYIAKVFLVMASPIFKDMFSLPQLPQSTGRIEALHLPVVDIAEHGNVTDVLLRFIYPTDEPELPVELMSGVLIVAQKYEMHCALKWAKKVIRTMCAGDGSAVLQAFALACNHYLEDETRLAAWNSLQYPLLGSPFIHSLRLSIRKSIGESF